MSVLTPISAAEWNRATARHLLNRAGFGVPLAAVEYLAKVGPEKAVSSFVDFEQFDDTMAAPDFLPSREQLQELYRAARAETDETKRQQLQNQIQQLQRQAIERLKGWWLNHMQFSSRPLQEKLSLLWHGHFATSAEKVDDARHNWQLMRLFREHAAGNFKQLVTAVGKSPAMLRYLDNVQNRKGHPNENWARELMELFTLGIGNYGEHDIKEAARAFSGWAYVGDSFVYNLGEHDFGMKTFLGKRGLFDGEDVIDIIFEHPACARFICWKLCTFFVSETPGDELVDALANVFRESNYELKPVLRALFSSKAFYAASVTGAQIKSPVQYLIGLSEGLSTTPGRADLRQQRQLTLLLRAMGQDLLMPPNVKGWYGNRDWINTNTLLIRYNIAGALVNGLIPEELRERMRLDETEMDAMRLQAAENELRRRINAPFNALAWFRPHDGKTAGQIVDAAVEWFVGRPIDATQRAKLVASIRPDGNADATVRLNDTNEIYLRGMIHLVLSLAEYQCC